MKIVIWYCNNCDMRTFEGAVKTDKVCMRCKRGLIYRVELDFEGEKVDA